MLVVCFLIFFVDVTFQQKKIHLPNHETQKQMNNVR